MPRRRAQAATRWVILIALAAGIATGAWLVIGWALRPTVSVTEAVEAPVVRAFYSTGTIQPEREYPIKSNTAGTISQVLVDKGDTIAKGQPLAIVTDPALIFAADKALAELSEMQSRADEKNSPVLQEFDSRLRGTQDLLAIAQRDLDRSTGLMENKAGAQNDLDRAMDRVKQLMIDTESIKSQKAAKRLELQREVEVAQAALKTAKWNIEEQTLKSPIDGVVLDRPTPIGTRLAINDPVLRVANVAPANLVMRADVDEEDVAHVNLGQTIRMTLYAFNDRAFTGKVTRIYDQADSARRTFEVDVRLEESPPRLQAGMTGELAFIEAAKDRALIVPSQAVQDNHVFVLRGRNVMRTEVGVGIRSIERTEITSGLSRGDTVVISPTAALSSGQAVRTRHLDPVVASGLNKPPPITEAFKGF